MRLILQIAAGVLLGILAALGVVFLVDRLSEPTHTYPATVYAPGIRPIPPSPTDPKLPDPPPYVQPSVNRPDLPSCNPVTTGRSPCNMPPGDPGVSGTSVPPGVPRMLNILQYAINDPKRWHDIGADPDSKRAAQVLVDHGLIEVRIPQNQYRLVAAK